MQMQRLAPASKCTLKYRRLIKKRHWEPAVERFLKGIDWPILGVNKENGRRPEEGWLLRLEVLSWLWPVERCGERGWPGEDHAQRSAPRLARTRPSPSARREGQKAAQGAPTCLRRECLVPGRIEGTGYPKSVATWRKSRTGQSAQGGKAWGPF